jgi:methyltransferase
MDTRLVFVLVLVALAAQRLLELRRSARNESVLRARGAVEHGAGHMPVMRALHTLWFLAMLAEVFFLDRPFVPWLAAVGVAGLAVGQMLRYAAIRTLGERWSVNVLVLPGEAPVAGGIYRYVRHPNYAGVILEIACVPLIHSAFLTAVVFTVLNALLLRHRIAVEERALHEAGGYAERLGERPRFVPRRSEA